MDFLLDIARMEIVYLHVSPIPHDRHVHQPMVVVDHIVLAFGRDNHLVLGR